MRDSYFRVSFWVYDLANVVIDYVCARNHTRAVEEAFKRLSKRQQKYVFATESSYVTQEEYLKWLKA